MRSLTSRLLSTMPLHVLVVEQVRVLDLELEPLAVAAAQAALHHAGAADGRVGALDDLHQPGAVAGAHEQVEVVQTTSSTL